MDPFDQGELDVGDGHVLYYEQVGAPSGVPVVYLHGGPGSGATTNHRGFFDPSLHRGVLFDQRGAGRSTPNAGDPECDWASIDMDHHVGDIELLRNQLGIPEWMVFGLSWGSVLGATYTERHPEHVLGVVLGAVSTGTAADIEWLTVHAGRFFPAEWHEFRDHVPLALRHLRLVDAYHQLVMDPDPAVHGPAAAAWCRWEEAHIGTSDTQPNPRYQDPKFRLGFTRQVTHCWSNASWLAPDDIVTRAHTLADIPCRLIHGRLDVSSPLDSAWRLHQAWPNSTLTILDGVGHGGQGLGQTCRSALAEMASAST